MNESRSVPSVIAFALLAVPGGAVLPGIGGLGGGVPWGAGGEGSGSVQGVAAGSRFPSACYGQQAYLKASSPAVGQEFGFAVAAAGETLAVGTWSDDGAGTNAGAVHVFVREAGVWSLQARLQASNADVGDRFGWSLALSGDTLVVGALEEDSRATGVNGDPSDDFFGADSGAAYVFVRSGSSWSQEAYLKASNTGIHDRFGSSVAISGDTVVVGAALEDSRATGVDGDQLDDGAYAAGAAYVFRRGGSGWSQEAYLKASNTGSNDNFGSAVAVCDDLVAVGAPGEDSGASGMGGNQEDNGASAAGAVYVFARSGSSWSQELYLKASNTDASDQFGTSLALSAATLVVGAPREDGADPGVDGDQTSNALSDAGAAYVFVRGAGWSQEAYVKASNPGSGDLFGTALSVAGDFLCIGAPREDSAASGLNGDPGNAFAGTQSGAAYLFQRTGTSWAQEHYVKASNTGGGDSFGGAVAVAHDGTLVIGAVDEDGGASGVGGNQEDETVSGAGAAYAFGPGLAAAVQLRNAGTNPASYAAGPIVIGGVFSASVDNALAGQVSSIVFAFDTALTLPLGGGQTLLCVDSGPGELFTGAALAPSSSAGGLDAYSLGVPADPALCGQTLCSQAIQFGNPPFVLSNAQDLTVGSF